MKAAVVNLHLPFVMSATSVVVIVAALCGLLGLFLFIRGFFELQRSGSKHTTPKLEFSFTKPLAAVASRSSQISARTEVIRLTADDGAATVTMSQQGKIAAALLKAGVPSPASWNTDSASAVGVANDTKTSPALQTSKLKLTQPDTTPAASEITEPRNTHPTKQTKKNAAWMVWTGVALTLISVYVLAARFGWL